MMGVSRVPKKGTRAVLHTADGARPAVVSRVSASGKVIWIQTFKVDVVTDPERSYEKVSDVLEPGELRMYLPEHASRYRGRDHSYLVIGNYKPREWKKADADDPKNQEGGDQPAEEAPAVQAPPGGEG